MNKRIIKIVLVLFGFLAIVAAFVYYFNYQNSFRTIFFEIKDGVVIDIYNKDTSDKIASLGNSGDLSIRVGEYTAIPSGLGYDTSPILFTVKEDAKVNISPDYSRYYLDNILKVEEPNIIKSINDTYSKVISSFAIGSGKLYKNGLWYGVTLTQKSSGEVYRLVMRKDGDKWSAAARPALVISSLEYTNIPIEILRDINQT